MNSSAISRPVIALAIIGVSVGFIFVAHGGLKVFSFGHAGVTDFLASLGIPFPAVAAVFTMAAEFAGGLLLVAGLFTPLASLALGVNMLVAIATAKLTGGFFAPGGFEFELLLAIISFTLAWTGAGAYSLDAKRRGRPAT